MSTAHTEAGAAASRFVQKKAAVRDKWPPSTEPSEMQEEVCVLTDLDV